MVSEYRHKRRVHFYETDMAGIVHFSCFFRFMEEAEHALWRHAGISIHPKDSKVGWPRVASSFDYHRPLRFEDEFEVWIRVAEIREKTIRYTCLVTCNGSRIATGSLTIACVSKLPNEPMKSIPIPEDIVSRFTVSNDA